MRKYTFLLVIIGLSMGYSFGQFYETKPHFISIGGGITRNNFEETKEIGYYGNFEGAYFFHYLFGTGLKVDWAFMNILPNKFADNYTTKPDISYNRTTVDVDIYQARNYTANAYFNAMPNESMSFMLTAGAGFQVLTTPKGSVLYEEVYPYNNYGTPIPNQDALVIVKQEKYRPVVFHAGIRANFMFNENVGLNIFADYHFAKNRYYIYEQHHQFSGGVGLIFMFPEIY